MKNSSRSIKTIWLRMLGLFTATALLAAAPLHAEDADPADRVARLSFIEGDIALQPQQASEWTSARLNRPLTTGDRLSLGDDARGELQAGNVTLHLGRDTDVEVLELSDSVLQLKLTQGSVHVRVRSLDRDEVVEVDTPTAAITVNEPGTYRIDVEDEELTLVQVRDGSAEVSGERQSFQLRENEQVTLRGSGRFATDFSDVERADEFDRWAEARNRRAERVASARYVPQGLIGYEDLDDYGDWRYEADYGYVWWPARVSSSWAPYRFGHWVWIAPWGWTWVDDAPWGFAPFHYGRWAQVRDRWCWVPGPRSVRPVYAPALVAWLDSPSLTVSVRVGGGPVGWVPLGPREVFRPYYRGSERYIERVNLSNSLLNRADFERNFQRPPHEERFMNRGAISVVSGDVMRDARPVNRDLLRLRGDSMPRLAPQPPAIQPGVGTVLGGPRRGNAPPRIERDVVSRREPMPVPRRAEMPLPIQPAAPRSNVRVIEPPRTRYSPVPEAPPGLIRNEPPPSPGPTEERIRRDRDYSNRPAPQIPEPRPQINAPRMEERRGLWRPGMGEAPPAAPRNTAPPAAAPPERPPAPAFSAPRPERAPEPRREEARPPPEMERPTPRPAPTQQAAPPRMQPPAPSREERRDRDDRDKDRGERDRRER